jgi:hypothetical protein
MITTLDIIDIAWHKVDGGPLKTALKAGGGVYKYQRPVNSTKEDIVINSLPINNEQLQQGVFNINIYVPDLPINENGAQINVPDFVRLKELAAIAVAEMNEEWADDYNFSVQQQTVIADEVSKSHYINLRIDFFNINISN